MHKTILISIEAEELQSFINDCITRCFEQYQSERGKEEVLEVDDVCRMFGVSRTTVYEWRRTGKVKSYQRGRRIYFKKSELLKFRSDEKEGGEL